MKKEIYDGNELSKFIKMIAIVLVVFGIFYLITTFVSKEKKINENQTSTPAVIQYDEIILGELYTQSQSEYYVLIKERKDPYLELFTNIVKQYVEKEGALPTYTVDLGNAFNFSYQEETSSYEKGNLKVKGTTLVKVKDQQVVEYHETSESILAKLKELIK